MLTELTIALGQAPYALDHIPGAADGLANSFAIDVSSRNGRSASARQAALQIISSAAWIFVTASASGKVSP
jgi:hypothetical protein